MSKALAILATIAVLGSLPIWRDSRLPGEGLSVWGFFMHNMQGIETPPHVPVDLAVARAKARYGIGLMS